MGHGDHLELCIRPVQRIKTKTHKKTLKHDVQSIVYLASPLDIGHQT